ncbi:MAG: endo alpha-1,4 polygalactosaminidase [Chloroflexi bacterium]|nr:endo alpha-1,4 polygalactosaminidase [Chloroflexota bacterium]MBP7042818.1 endo alpha-1,4 polygalactosaminidase [Chloroflexota bacterium]
MKPRSPSLLLLLLALLLAACNEQTEQLTANSEQLTENEAPSPQSPTPNLQPPTPTPQSPSAIWQPTPGTSWQWQLTGDIDTSLDVAMYDIDLFDAPQAVIEELKGDGRIVICYFSAGSYEEWRNDAGDFPPEALGETLDGWPDERWLDIRNRAAIEPIMARRLDTAVQKGCDGVEPDNVTAYANDSGFAISEADQIAYNIWLAEAAHARGLSIGLKNALDLVDVLEPHFDWALNEECYQYDECEALRPFTQAGKAVFGVEYAGNPAEFCPVMNELDYDWLFKRLDLDAWRIACREET